MPGGQGQIVPRMTNRMVAAAPIVGTLASYSGAVQRYAPLVKYGLEHANRAGAEALHSLAGQLVTAAEGYQGLSDAPNKRQRSRPDSDFQRIRNEGINQIKDESRKRKTAAKQPARKSGQQTLPFRSRKVVREPVLKIHLALIHCSCLAF